MAGINHSARFSKGGWILGRILINALWRTAIVALVAFIDPFEVVQWTTARTHEIWERVQAANYSQAAHHDQSRNLVTIVYLDRATLPGTGFTLPLSLRNQGMLLEDVVNLAGGYGPRNFSRPTAVFVDLLLTNAAPQGASVSDLITIKPTGAGGCEPSPGAVPAPNPPTAFHCYVRVVEALTRYAAWSSNPLCQVSTLSKIDCIQAAGGVPIFFASPAPSGASSPTEDIGQAVLDQVAATVPATVSLNGYELAIPETEASRRHRLFRLTPAAALYAASCSSAPSDHCPQSPIDRTQPEPQWSERFDRPIDVTWGVGYPDEFTRMVDRRHVGALDQRCRVARAGAVGMLQGLFKEVFSGIDLTASKPVCPYAHAIPYADLQDGGFSQEDAERALSRKLVIIGSQFDTVDDWVSAAPHGQLPGAYLHAMALDNLLFAGANYSAKSSALFPGFAITRRDAGNLAAVFCLFCLAGIARVFLNTPLVDPSDHARRTRAEGGSPKLHPWDSYMTRWWFRLGFGLILYGTAVVVIIVFIAVEQDSSLQFNTAALLLITFGAMVEIGAEILRPLNDEHVFPLPSIAQIWRFIDLKTVRFPDRNGPPAGVPIPSAENPSSATLVGDPQ